MRRKHGWIYQAEPPSRYGFNEGSHRAASSKQRKYRSYPCPIIRLVEFCDTQAAFRLGKALIALKDYSAAKDLIEEFVLSSSSPMSLTEEERKSFQELCNQILSSKSQQENLNLEEEASVQFVKRPLSIREFTQQKELGYGNFSEIWVVSHKVTKERFALKKIPKKQAADLAKRQHPNVYNEIQMERRVLLERLPPCPFIIRMYHAFQDYEHLYYLMELHDQWSDLWSQLRWKDKGYLMVGCHRSQAKIWLYQLVLALEHLHRHGIVHRDIKCENILLNRKGHLVLIDFGTAKDLIQTDLNGPEFVGTPDFMSPEAVSGDDKSSETKAGEDKQQPKQKLRPATWAADLWALGALGYILQTGVTPFWTTSPYLAFLRIQRGLLTRHTGIIHDDCWDWIRKLTTVQPEQRLGAQAFDLVVDGQIRRVQDRGDGYAEIKKHPYLAPIHNEYAKNAGFRQEAPVPSLLDLCYRAVADLAVQDCQDIDLCERHPPGDGSAHDLLRLSSSPTARNAVLHLLDRQQLFRKEPRLWGRFFSTPVEARLVAKIRPGTRDVVGLTQMNDDQGKAPQAAEAQQFDKKPRPVEFLEFVQICSPLFFKSADTHEEGEDAEAVVYRKQQIKMLKKCVARINKMRPKLVVVCSAVVLDDASRRVLARINESIPVVFHEAKDGKPFFGSFWMAGIQGLCLSYQLAMVGARTPQQDGNSSTTTTTNPESPSHLLQLKEDQWAWLREQLDIARMSKHPLFCFVNGPPLDSHAQDSLCSC